MKIDRSACMLSDMAGVTAHACGRCRTVDDDCERDQTSHCLQRSTENDDDRVTLQAVAD